MDVLRLTAADRRLLAARFAEHGNSHRRMAEALSDATAAAPLARLRALRGLECRFSIDLGSLCHRDERRDARETHPLERRVLAYIARRLPCEEGGEALLVLVDRVRQVRHLIDQGSPAASAGD